MNPVRPMLGTGVVRHRRLRPRVNAFSYPTYFLMLPMRALGRSPAGDLVRNRFGLLSFHDKDHGDGSPDALAWVDALLQAEGIHEATGETWLQTYPRVLGYAFKPVSFWYCHRPDDSLAAIVVEVNNTFGERHCYLLAGPELGWGRQMQASKVFHVSPFCALQGGYRFRFMRTADRVVARVDHDDAQGALLETSVSGQLSPLTPRAVRAAFFGLPMMTLGVMARIHWQAWRLWRLRVPFVPKPAPPQRFVSR